MDDICIFCEMPIEQCECDDDEDFLEDGQTVGQSDGQTEGLPCPTN